MRLDLLLIFSAVVVLLGVPFGVMIDMPETRKPIILAYLTMSIIAGIGYLFYIAV